MQDNLEDDTLSDNDCCRQWSSRGSSQRETFVSVLLGLLWNTGDVLWQIPVSMRNVEVSGVTVKITQCDVTWIDDSMLLLFQPYLLIWMSQQEILRMYSSLNRIMLWFTVEEILVELSLKTSSPLVTLPVFSSWVFTCIIWHALTCLYL